MSGATQTPETSHKRHRDHERSSNKSSHKKRKRDGEREDLNADDTRASPTKKRRRKERDRDAHMSSGKYGKSKSRPSKTALEESQQSTQSQTTPPQPAPLSPFALQTTSLYLPLSPIAQASPTAGLCAEHLSPLILTYVPALGGILLSYNNTRVSSTLPGSSRDLTKDADVVVGKTMDEYAFSYAWLTADFLLLKPTPGAEMEGYVNVQNESRLGVLCWNLFNASIERKRLPKDWRWDGPTSRRRSSAQPRQTEIEDGEGRDDNAPQQEPEPEGGFLDGNAEAVMGRKVKFKMIDWELDQSGKPVDASSTTSSLVSFEGTMLNDEEEEKLLRQAKIKEADRLATIRKARERKLKARHKAQSANAEE
ncbi:MAG: hypothetical protein Q9159_003467 [Coniocarpon cinnabarinum]